MIWFQNSWTYCTSIIFWQVFKKYIWNISRADALKNLIEPSSLCHAIYKVERRNITINTEIIQFLSVALSYDCTKLWQNLKKIWKGHFWFTLKGPILVRYVHECLHVCQSKGSLAFMQHFKFVNWWIRGFVFWCHKQVKSVRNIFVFALVF